MPKNLIKLALASLVVLALPRVALADDCGWFDPLGSCKAAKQAAGAAEKIRLEMEELRKTFAESVDAAAKALPNERFARMIDNLGSPNEKIRKEQQAFFARLAGQADTMPIAQYKLVLGFEFDEAKTFHVDFGRFPVGDRSVLEAWLLRRSENLDVTPRRSSLLPLSDEQLKKVLEKRADNLVKALTGNTKVDNAETPPCAPQVTTILERDILMPSKCVIALMPDALWSDRSIPIHVPGGSKRINDSFNKRREEVKTALVDLTLGAYSKALPITQDNWRDWSVADSNDFVFVVMDEATYDAQKDFTITVRVQKSDDPTVSLYNRPTHRLTRKDFDPKMNAPIARTDATKVYWAFREMTGQISTDPTELKRLTDLKKILSEYKRSPAETLDNRK